MKKLCIDHVVDLLFEGFPTENWEKALHLFKETKMQQGVNFYDFEMLVNNIIPSFAEMPHDFLRISAATLAAMIIYFVDAGRYVIAPTEDLVIALLNTKFMNMRISDITIPYPTFYLLLPRHSFIYPHPVAKEKEVWLEGVIVRYTGTSMQMSFISDFSDQVDVKSPSDWNYATEPIAMNFHDVKEDSTFKDAWGDIEKELANEPMKLDLLALVINIMLFLSASKEMAYTLVDNEYIELNRRLAAVKSTAKRQKLSKKLARTSPSRVHTLHPNKRYIWKLRPESSKQPRQKSEALNTERTRKSMRLHIVSGHFRNQPYGPKHTLRKVIWIEPFWRGHGSIGTDNIIILR